MISAPAGANRALDARPVGGTPGLIAGQLHLRQERQRLR